MRDHMARYNALTATEQDALAFIHQCVYGDEHKLLNDRYLPGPLRWNVYTTPAMNRALGRAISLVTLTVLVDITMVEAPVPIQGVLTDQPGIMVELQPVLIDGEVIGYIRLHLYHERHR